MSAALDSSTHVAQVASSMWEAQSWAHWDAVEACERRLTVALVADDGSPAAGAEIASAATELVQAQSRLQAFASLSARLRDTRTPPPGSLSFDPHPQLVKGLS